MMPDPRAQLLLELQTVAAAMPDCIALLSAGSLAAGTMDAHSDLDLVLVAAPGAEGELVAALPAMAEAAGGLLSAFPGDHVGERRLLICLYGPPLVHVDLKAVGLADLVARVDDNVVLWSRDARAADALRTSQARYPQPDAQWIEDRFWTWIHYACTKIARGELFEALDLLSFLRGRVLGPLALQRAGAQSNGVRRLELAAPAFAGLLAATVARPESSDAARALQAAVVLYRELRTAQSLAVRRLAAEAAVTAHLDALCAALSHSPPSHHP